MRSDYYRRSRAETLKRRPIMTSQLPSRPFYWTVDQVASILQVRLTSMKNHLYYIGRTPGLPRPDQLKATNVAPDTGKPVWRVEDRELKRWLKHRAQVIYPPYNGRAEGVGDPEDLPMTMKGLEDS